MLDTNAYTAIARGEAAAVAISEAAPRLAIPFVVEGELLTGFKLGAREEKNRAELSAFLDLPSVVTIHSNATTCDQYANILCRLRGKGTPIPTNDIWIAAATLACGGVLFTYDTHFKQVDGLLWGNTRSKLLL